MLRLQDLTSFVDRVSRETLVQRRIAGLSVSVSHRGDLVYSDGHGYANIPLRIPATTSTIYSLGSMTKQFTAVAVLQLAERGRLSLEDPIASHLPRKSRVTSRASIRDVLSHTAGIRGDVERIMLADSRDPHALTREAALSLVSNELFDARPSEVWRYSNFGYYLLGIAIEEITGEPYSEYLQTHVLSPAGLSNTTYGIESVPPNRLARGYTEQGDGFASVDLPCTEQTFSSGGLFSSVLDLQLWKGAPKNGCLLQTSSYIEMTTPARLLNGQKTNYGLGFFLGACGSYREIGHDGTSGGFSGQAAFYPEADLSVVVLMNCERHEAERLEKTISRHVLGVAEPRGEDCDLSPDNLAKFVGTYTHKGVDLPVRADGGGLSVSIPNRRVVRLRYQGDSTFAESDDPSTRYEFTIHADRADSFIVLREGKLVANARRMS